jgi:hypothetical protein
MKEKNSIPIMVPKAIHAFLPVSTFDKNA